LGQEHERKQTFKIGSDHPEVFSAKDSAPTPPEILLAALASCLTGGVAAVAQHRGILEMDPWFLALRDAQTVKTHLETD